MNSGPSNPIIGTILGIGCLVGGYFLMERVGKPMRAQAAASSAWPSTDGRITQSKLNRTEPGRDRKKSFSMDIAYEYILDGRKREGSRVWFGGQYGSSDPTVFEDAVGRYPVGKAVKVFYDPANPEVSVLEPGATWSASIWYLVGVGLMVFGAVALASSGIVFVFLAAAVASAVGGSGDGSSDFDRPRPHPTGGGGRPQPRDEHDDGIDIV